MQSVSQPFTSLSRRMMELPSSPLRSHRFRRDPVLLKVAVGSVRLGRPRDGIGLRSEGTSVARVQQALTDLGAQLPRYGVDGRFGDETYNTVLAYKRRHGIASNDGSIDGIVGPKTIAHLDRVVSTLPLPPCVPLNVSIPQAARGRRVSRVLLPHLTCSGQRSARGLRESESPTPDLPDGWRKCGLNWKICNGWVGFFYADSLSGKVRNVRCRFEVGVPDRNYLGPVGDSFASDAAMEAANTGGLELQRKLRAGDPLGNAPDTVICKAFRSAMEEKLKLVIPGCRVAPVGTSRCP